MRKLFVIAIMFLILFGAFPIKGVSQPSQDNANLSNYQVIPNEAIRLRILANSDGDKDQQLKQTIRDQVNKEITTWVEDIKDIEHAREMIQARLADIEEIVGQVLEEADSDQTYQVEYGDNVEFPAKLYGNFVYPAGNYEAILVTLGEGKGANWWCVLFPPLCFLDFSNGTSVADEEEQEQQESVEKQESEEEEVEVKFFVFDWFSDWFS